MNFLLHVTVFQGLHSFPNQMRILEKRHRLKEHLIVAYLSRLLSSDTLFEQQWVKLQSLMQYNIIITNIQWPGGMHLH